VKGNEFSDESIEFAKSKFAEFGSNQVKADFESADEDEEEDEDSEEKAEVVDEAQV
jgi:hypothetical protein